ncbi:hypothetical protein J5TS2_27520 [Brevibacillus halotolerans]|nr:hypothetical protein J5TS2_27520 [Brevibacillus halotolerans]
MMMMGTIVTPIASLYRNVLIRRILRNHIGCVGWGIIMRITICIVVSISYTALCMLNLISGLRLLGTMLLN